MNRRDASLLIGGAPLAWQLVARAAERENPPHSVPDGRPSCLDPPSYRGVPAESARAWVRGAEKHRHRVVIRRRPTRPPAGAGGRTGAPQGRRHRLGRCGSNPSCQGRHRDDSDCDDAGKRSGCERVCRQSCATRRQYHRLVNALAGAARKATRAFQTDRSRARTRGCARLFDRPGRRTGVKRNRSCGAGARCADAICAST